MAMRKHASTPADFREFCEGYITAALWSSTDESDESGGAPLDSNYSASDIASSSLHAMKNDCAKFYKKNKKDLRTYGNNVSYSDTHGRYGLMSLAGHDFWLTANGHGAGFWDRDRLPKVVGDRLSDAAKKFASDLYVGDDGKIYVTPERR